MAGACIRCVHDARRGRARIAPAHDNSRGWLHAVCAATVPWARAPMVLSDKTASAYATHAPMCTDSDATRRVLQGGQRRCAEQPREADAIKDNLLASRVELRDLGHPRGVASGDDALPPRLGRHVVDGLAGDARAAQRTMACLWRRRPASNVAPDTSYRPRGLNIDKGCMDAPQRIHYLRRNMKGEATPHARSRADTQTLGREEGRLLERPAGRSDIGTIGPVGRWAPDGSRQHLEEERDDTAPHNTTAGQVWEQCGRKCGRSTLEDPHEIKHGSRQNGPRIQKGGRPNEWPDSASHSSEFDENPCRRRLLMRRNRNSRPAKEPASRLCWWARFAT